MMFVNWLETPLPSAGDLRAGATVGPVTGTMQVIVAGSGSGAASPPARRPGRSFADELGDDALDAVAEFDQSFTWNGAPYSCVINYHNQSLVVAKALFGGVGNRKYPKRGDAITIDGKVAQVKKLQNAQLGAVRGGYTEDKVFIDDPSSPLLEIGFGQVITK